MHIIAAKLSLKWGKEYGMQYQFFEECCEYYEYPNITIVTTKGRDHVIKVGGISLGG
ncbi:hypothetical protein [Niallia sp. 01092]|uniref:hypothetical protein n=1 Tax=unclassified Niallia TaxID=2837522 RepID=UPI003FD5DB53